MTLDPEVFAELMSVLADRFNRPLHPRTQLTWYEILSRELTTDEFVAATELAFRNSTYWPSPKELIEYIRPPRDLGLEASQAFDKVLSLGKYTPQGTGWLRSEVEAEVGAAGAAAFAAIGAQGRLRNITTDDLPWARREFIAAYKAHAVHASHELAASEARRLPRLVPQQRLIAERTG